MVGGHRTLFRLGAAMPSAGTLCQLLALGLLVETRLELAAQKQNDSTVRRFLFDGASYATVAQTETIVAAC